MNNLNSLNPYSYELQFNSLARDELCVLSFVKENNVNIEIKTKEKRYGKTQIA